MRQFLVSMAWLGVLGALTDGAITTYAAWEVVQSPALDWQLTVDEHLRSHLQLIYWVKDVAYLLAPDAFIDWMFGLPALVYFPFRILINIFFGWWMFSLARRMRVGSGEL